MAYRQITNNPQKNMEHLVIFLLFLKGTSGIVPSLIKVDGENELPGKLQTNTFRHIGRYEILRPDTTCEISTCHDSTEDTRRYHNYCFQQQCSYGSFQCINGSGKVITFCAEFNDYPLRYRHIVVLNKQRPGSVDIYEIHCEVGFFQKNDRHSFFAPCAKDTSITLIEPSGVNSTQLAFCKPELGCNPHGRMLFELDTKYDDCTGSIHCPPSLDRLPDCSCDEPCPPNFERIPKNKFSCSLRNGSINDEDTIPSNGGSSRSETTVADEFEENASISETDDVKGDKNEETTKDHADNEINDLDNNKQEEINSSSNDYAFVWKPIVVVIGATISITGTVVIIRRSKIAESGQSDPEAPERHPCLNKTGSVTNKTNTTINDNSTLNKITIKNPKNVHIYTGSAETDSRPDTNIDMSTTEPEELQMGLLKEQVFEEGDASLTQPKQL